MKLEIRIAGPQDIPQIITLLRDFAKYEKLSEYCTITPDKLHDVMFGPEAYVRAMVAANGERVVGFAIFFRFFASFRGERGVYLEDLYVDPEFRRSGAGDKILRAIARTAKADGFERIDFQVLDWNEPAIAFYRKLGAEANADETHFRFGGSAFARLAEE
jgi:ribosomal protein S18 acetylase RimI-like enzyme